MTVDVNKLFDELGHLSQVEAIALGGSRATGRNDEKSDYDVYVYITGCIDENVRRSILKKLAVVPEGTLSVRRRHPTSPN